MSSIRVTQQSATLGVQANLNRGISQLQRLQEKLSSGREISKPSDNPGGTSAALSLRASIARQNQFDRNAIDGVGWLDEADAALQGGSAILQRARSLALSAVNGAMNDTDREAIAKEVDALREELLSVANTSRLGRPLFSGTAVPGPGQSDVAYDATGAYQGDAGKVLRPVADGSTVQVNLTGPEVFGPAGADVFKTLSDLSANIRANSPAVTSVSVKELDTGLNRLLGGLATIGARTNQLERLQTRNQLSLDGRVSSPNDIESIDIAKTTTDLKLQEVAYQASLAAAARVIQPSLMDFLR